MAEKTYGKSLTIYYCGMEECPKSHAFGPAVRTQYLLHFIMSGKGVYSVGGRKFPLRAGQGFLIKPGELTYYQADKLEPWSYMWVAFDGYEARRILDSCGVDYTMNAPKPAEFGEKLRELIDIFGGEGHNEYEYLSVFYSMMSQLLREQPKNAGSFAQLYMEKAADYMQGNFSYAISIMDVAAYVGIDRSYLYKLFVSSMGMSPMQYLLGIRINAAKGMILENIYTLTQVALSCGFRDAPSLCAQFKKITGKTPKQFKAELQMNQQQSQLQ